MERRDGRRNASGRRARRRIRIAGFIALIAAVAATVAVVACVAFPVTDPLPKHADVAVVLGPPTATRVSTATALLKADRVGAVVISISADSVDVPYWKRICNEPHMACRVASPYTTQGEGRFIKSMAAEQRWRSAVLITQTAHITRARMIVGQCFTGAITMRSSGEPPSGGWLYQFAYQAAATAKFWAIDHAC